MPLIHCRTLGPVDLQIDGEPAPPELRWRKHLALLLYLARSPRGTRSREHLLGLLWSDKPEAAARHSLNVALHTLRRETGDDELVTSGSHIRLGSGAVTLDVDELDRCAAAGDWAGAAALTGGEFCEGLAIAGASEFEDWLTTERAHWQRRQVEVLLRHVEELEQAGRAREATRFAERARALDSTFEPAVRALLRSLALSGNRAAALTVFETFARELAARLSVEPEAETRALAELLRSGRGVWMQTTPPESRAAATRRLPLTGRDRELRRVLEVLAGSRTGSRAALVVLEAAPGLGRTRLLEEVVERAVLSGDSVLTARAVAADREEPWSGILALARGGLLQARGIAAASPAALAAFAARLPDWAERFPHLQKAEALSPGRALTELLRVAAEERPVLVVADDAEWLDQESYGGLETLLRDLATARVAVALSVAAGNSPGPLDQLRARIGRDIAGEVVRLEPLGAAEIAELVATILHQLNEDQRDRLARRVLADSAGLPLFIVELLHAVAAGLDLGAVADGWPAPFRTLDHTRPGDLPDAIVAAIRVGFRRLSSGAQRALTIAAVLRERVTADQVAWVAQQEPEATLAALDELEWSRWLIAEARGYAFVARIVREVVGRDMLTPGQRQRIADRAAQWRPPDQGAA
jgi:DNA-binding SARP family transcriptional activator